MIGCIVLFFIASMIAGPIYALVAVDVVWVKIVAALTLVFFALAWAEKRH